VGSVVHRAGCNVAETPQRQQGRAEGLRSPHGGRRCPPSARRRGGRYGWRSSLAVALGNSHTACPTSGGHDHARVRAGGRRRRRSQRPRWNDGERVQVRQAWGTETASATRTWGLLTTGSLCATSDPRAVAGSLCSRAVSNHGAGKRSALQGARSVWQGGKTVKSYLSLPSKLTVGPNHSQS